MKKAKKLLKITTDNREYNASNKELYGNCKRCPWHRGCNREGRYRKHSSWKKDRKNQWKY